MINTQKGFTLVELLLYIALVSVLLLSISLFTITLLQARVKNQTIGEVNTQGLHAMHVITQTIRNAEEVTSPSAASSGVSVVLDVVDAGDDPTIFSILEGILGINEGGGSFIPLTNNRVTASNLTFWNYSRTDTSGIVHVTFTLTYQNPEGRHEYDYTRTFMGGASLR